MPAPALHARREIGRGRSGVVYLQLGPDRDERAIKVFKGEGASSFVLWLLTGAPNPYNWDQNAVATAVFRRKILSVLVHYWFGDRLRLPRIYGWSWNTEHCAFQFEMEYIHGHHAPLKHPGTPYDNEPIDDLVKHIMKPLQHHLIEAGFDGVVWQAGLGNPVAANNFMIDTPKSEPERTRTEISFEVEAGKKEQGNISEHLLTFSHCSQVYQVKQNWVWIDLESGVPALFPFNFVRLLDYYLPKSWSYSRPLFDDVNISLLDAYLSQHRRLIEAKLGSKAFEDILVIFNQLASHQSAWKGLNRLRRSITYAIKKGLISDRQGDWYTDHPIRWYTKLTFMSAVSTLRSAIKQIKNIGSALCAINWKTVGRVTWLFSSSQRFRTHLGRRYVWRRIKSWEKRGFLVSVDANKLRRELRHEESAEYVTDFGVHVAIKPIMKTVQWLFVPVLMGASMINPYLGVALLASGGAIARTAYTSGRAVQALRRKQELPLVALGVGLVPIIGNVAYPAQLAYAAEHTHTLARFIIYDALASIGRAVPIWGGRDTITEHWFIRLFNTIENLVIFRSFRRSDSLISGE